jgi:hypothetical protein
LHAEALGHRDLHAIDVEAIPDRLEERIGETKVEEVLHRFLAEVVVNSKNRSLGEDLMQCSIQRPRRGEIAPERFLCHYPRLGRESCTFEPLDHFDERARWDGEIVERPLRRSQRSTQCGEGGGIGIVTVDVVQERNELVERSAVEPAMMLEAATSALAQLLDGPARLGDADDRYVQRTVPDKRF